MLILFLRAALLFLAAVVLMRVMGKRQIAQLQPYELVLAILMADLAAAPMGDTGIPLLYGVVPMLALMFMHTALTLCCMKSERLRRIIDGKSYAVIKEGRLQNKALDQLGFSISDLLEELRVAGFARIEDVGGAIIETSGKLSAFALGREGGKGEGGEGDGEGGGRGGRGEGEGRGGSGGGVPLPLILAGKIQKENMRRMDVSEAWLTAQLARADAPQIRNIALCSLNNGGKLVIYNRNASAAPVAFETNYKERERA